MRLTAVQRCALDEIDRGGVLAAANGRAVIPGPRDRFIAASTLLALDRKGLITWVGRELALTPEGRSVR